MPMLGIEISYQLKNGGARTTSGIVPIEESELDPLFRPHESSQSPAKHSKVAEERIAYLMHRRVFPDEVTPIENADDLKRLGIAGLRATLSDERGNTTIFTLIGFAE